MTCTVAKEGWSCGIAAGDDHPLCGSIIVDAEYASGQTLEAGCCAADIDRTIVFTYLDGSRGYCAAELEGLAFDTPLAAGEHTADLVYTGYYMNAKNYEKRSFPVSITVEDAAGPQIIGIRAESLKDVYMPGENARIAVYAVYEDGEESIDPDDCWDTFDSNVIGEQLVYVGFEGHITSLLMYVKDEGSGAGNAPDEEEEIHITPAPAEDTGHANIGSGADTGDPAGEDHGSESFSARTEEIIRASYEEMLSSEEILGLLTDSGRIDLEEGDVFSITVTVESGKHGGFSGLFSRTKERKYTSGTVIG